MKVGFRVPSLKKRLAARTSMKRFVRHSIGLKAPRGFGFLTNPRKAMYNRIYRRTTFGCSIHLAIATGVLGWAIFRAGRG